LLGRAGSTGGSEVGAGQVAQERTDGANEGGGRTKRKRHTGAARRSKRGGKKEDDYRQWIAANDALTEEDRELIREHIRSLAYKPRFSILMPVYDPPAEYLREAIESVRDQLYEDWELCVVDDASPGAEVREILADYADRDERVRPCFREENGGISACTNTALSMAVGDWIVLMDHDDRLSEHALYLVAERVERCPDAVIVYSDEDKLDEAGQRSSPYFKPDWDYDLFLGQNLINHLGAYRTDQARSVGGFREGFEGAQDWDFALRVLDASPGFSVEHVPFVLYHWRQRPEAFSKASLPRAVDAAQRAVNEHFERTGQSAMAEPSGFSSHLRIKRGLPGERPLVSIVIPTRDGYSLLRACVDGLIQRTDYQPLEIILVDNGSTAEDACALIEDLERRGQARVVRDDGPFNFSRLVNRGVEAAAGSVCVLLNNDIDVIRTDWLDEMVSHVVRPEVGAVGAKLYYANGSLQHGGVILGLGGVAAHAHRGAPGTSPGYMHRLTLTHSLSCVTGACVAVRRDVFQEIGGFDATNLAVSFNDIDFCIRLGQAGYRIIWTPEAELYHYESLSRGPVTATEASRRRNLNEKAFMKSQWPALLPNDPHYNPNLSLKGRGFAMAEVTRATKPWRSDHRATAVGSAVEEVFRGPE